MSAAGPFASVPFSTLSTADLSGVFSSLPKNASSRIELKLLLAFSRSLVQARGASWNAESALEQLEEYPEHEESVDTGFDESGFTWFASRLLLSTEDSNRKHQEAAAKAAKEAEEQRRREEEEAAAEAKAEEEREHQERERLAAREKELAAIAAAAASAAAASASAQQESTPIAASLPSSALLDARRSADTQRLSELELRCERQSKELEKFRGLMRNQTKMRAEWDDKQRETERKEESLQETIDMLQIKYTRERHKNRTLTSSFESQQTNLTTNLTASQNHTQKLVGELERASGETAKREKELDRLTSEVQELRDWKKTNQALLEGAKSSQKQVEKLREQLKEFAHVQAEYQTLQQQHAREIQDSTSLAEVYNQLRNAYESEEALYKDATQRLVILEKVIKEQRLEQLVEAKVQEQKNNGGDASSPLGAASPLHHGLAGSQEASPKHSPEEPLQSPLQASLNAAANIAASPKNNRESLLDDLLDVDEQQLAADASHLPEHHANLEEAPLPPTASLPASARTPAVALAAPISSASNGSVSPTPTPTQRALMRHYNSRTPPSHSPHNSLSAQLAASLGSVSSSQHQSTFAPHATDAAHINFQFFQLIAHSVASQLTCVNQNNQDGVALANHLKQNALAVNDLYEEAMEKQVDVRKYASWIEYKLRSNQSLATAAN